MLAAGYGPTLPLSASVWNGSYLGISCRQLAAGLIEAFGFLDSATYPPETECRVAFAGGADCSGLLCVHPVGAPCALLARAPSDRAPGSMRTRPAGSRCRSRPCDRRRWTAGRSSRRKDRRRSVAGAPDWRSSRRHRRAPRRMPLRVSCRLADWCPFQAQLGMETESSCRARGRTGRSPDH